MAVLTPGHKATKPRKKLFLGDLWGSLDGQANKTPHRKVNIFPFLGLITGGGLVESAKGPR